MVVGLDLAWERPPPRRGEPRVARVSSAARPLDWTTTPPSTPEGCQKNSGWPPHQKQRPEGVSELLVPSTYTSLNFHIIFGTKNRDPLLRDAWRADLHAYLGGITRNHKGVALAVGGIADHVHLLVSLSATVAVADFVRELKKASTSWIREAKQERAFAWQEGYAALSVGVNARDAVRKYIENQEEHHRRRTFREEYLDLLRDAHIEVDMQYFD